MAVGHCRRALSDAILWWGDTQTITFLIYKQAWLKGLVTITDLGDAIADPAIH